MHLSSVSLLRAWNLAFRSKTRDLTAFVTIFRLVVCARGTRPRISFHPGFAELELVSYRVGKTPGRESLGSELKSEPFSSDHPSHRIRYHKINTSLEERGETSRSTVTRPTAKHWVENGFLLICQAYCDVFLAISTVCISRY